jgi:glycosyltransferase involved in cell wall biosynthesis
LRTIRTAPAARLHSHTDLIGGVKVHYLATPLRYRWMGITPTLPWRLARTRRPDIVHLFGYRDFVTTVTSWWARLQGVPYVLEPLGMYVPRYRNLPLKRTFDALIGQWVPRRAALVVAVSGWELGHLLEAGVAPEKAGIRPNGFPLPRECERTDELRQRIGIAADAPLILSVGRISFEKGLDLLLRALADLPGVHLAVIGPDGGDGTLERLTGLRDELALGDRAHFLGPSDERGLGETYADADVFVLPSRNESFGLVAAEAVACGVPTVVTDHCGIAETLGDAALVVPCSVEGIRDGVARLLADHELRADLAAAGPEIARANSWEAMTERQLELYRQVLGARG